MGVAQARILSVLIIVFSLLTSFSVAALYVPQIPAGNGGCCVPQYEGSLDFSVGSPTQSVGQDYCGGIGSVYVPNCYANGALVDESVAYSGCCCNDFGGTAVSESSSLYVSLTYCRDYLGFNYVGEGNCQAKCNENTNYYFFSGSVRTTQGQALDNVNIVSSQVTTQTRSDGSFDFGAHQFQEGEHTFTFTAQENEFYECEPKTITRNINQDYTENVVLNCVEVEPEVNTCQPRMQARNPSTGQFQDITESFQGWGECTLVGNEFLRSREVQDANSCANSPSGIQYDAAGCSDQVISTSCNDGTFDRQKELCEGTEFIINGQYRNNPSCADIFPGTTGSITCTSNCLVEYSCENACDCTTEDQCTSATCATQCAQEPICLGCENIVSFIPTDAPTGDIFNLYDYVSTASGNYPDYPIKYFAGTRDVELDWNYNEESQCANELFGFDVMICEEDAGTGSCDTATIQVESLEGKSTTSFLFTNVLEADTSFCYNVIARTARGRFPAFEDNNLPCFSTGEQACMDSGFQGRNCVVQEDGALGPSSCDTYQNTQYTNLQTITETCDLGEVCIETAYVPGSDRDYESGATCIEQQPCASCNGMFGLFASYNLPAFYEDGTNIFSCEELLFSTEIGAIVPGTDNTYGTGQCYLDESKTLFSFYDECSQVTSCYDYLSRGTCGSDPCFKFTNVNTTNGIITTIDSLSGCEWVDYEAELGVGICQPKQEELQDCGLCDTNSPTGFCSPEMCGLYGNCLLKEKPLTFAVESFPVQDNRLDGQEDLPACFSISEYSCALYDTAEQCIGLLEEGQPLPQFDVVYQGTTIENRLEPYHRIAGTNKQLVYSNDYLGFGDCRWDDLFKRCYKDSNGFVGTQLIEDDCDENPSRNCYKDNEPPQTTIYLKQPEFIPETGETLPRYGTGEFFNIIFNVQDDYSTPEELTTYVSVLDQSCIDAGRIPCLGEQQTGCLSSSSSLIDIDAAYNQYGCFIYPQFTLEQLQEVIDSGDTPLTLDSGHYQLVYFSEDQARNLEELKMEEIYIDGTNPEISFVGPDYTVLQPYEDIFVTDVSIGVNVLEESTCEARVFTSTNQEEPIAPGVITFSAVPGQTHQLFYPQLEDGDYFLEVECYDASGNRGFQSLEVPLNSDTSITLLSPKARIYQLGEEIVLQIATDNPGSCKYDFALTSFADSYSSSRYAFNFDGEEEGVYYFTDILPSNLAQSSGVYLIQTSCSFNNGDITDGQGGDILSFAIDDLAPNGDIREGETTYSGSTSTWRNSRTLTLVCDDTTETTPTGFNFGCGGIYYCITPKSDLSSFNQGEPSASCNEGNDYYYYEPNPSGNGDFTFTVPIEKDVYEYAYLHYFFEDTKGKRSDVFKVNTKVRDTDISRPLVVID